jgi:hypothetical protein
MRVVSSVAVGVVAAVSATS